MSTDAFENSPRRWDVIAVFASTTIVGLGIAPWYGWYYGYEASLWILFALFVAWNSLSITAGYHRLWSHKSYQAHPLVRFFFALGGALSIQNSIKEWCADHRNHHRYVDDPDTDPYSIKRGLWFSHIGWMLKDYPSGNTDFSNIEDLEKDEVVNWQHRHYWTLTVALNVGLPLAIGFFLGTPLGALLLLGFLRLVVCHHTTFLINSLAHYWGRQPYSDNNSSRDNPVIALLTFGEGFHNFHHTFEWDYRNGVRWYHFDPTKWLIRSLSWIRLTWGLKMAAPEKIEKSVLRMQLKSTTNYVRQLGSDTEEWLTRLEREYEQLINVLNEWARCRQQWVRLKKNNLLKRWDKTEIKTRLREVESRLEEQRERWYSLTQQFSYAH
ncbi:MAG: acyl-CoA desaturase [Pseudomonadales bacterium]